jgi:hypothetical protein
MNTAPKILTREMVLKLRWKICGIGGPSDVRRANRGQSNAHPTEKTIFGPSRMGKCHAVDASVAVFVMGRLVESAGQGHGMRFALRISVCECETLRQKFAARAVNTLKYERAR